MQLLWLLTVVVCAGALVLWTIRWSGLKKGDELLRKWLEAVWFSLLQPAVSG